MLTLLFSKASKGGQKGRLKSVPTKEEKKIDKVLKSRKEWKERCINKCLQIHFVSSSHWGSPLLPPSRYSYPGYQSIPSVQTIYIPQSSIKDSRKKAKEKEKTSKKI